MTAVRPFHEIERERGLQQQWLDTLLAADHDLRYSLRQLKNLEDQSHVEKWIDELQRSLRILSDGPDGEPLPVILADWLRHRKVRAVSRRPSLEDLNLEPRIERGGIVATRARLTELIEETQMQVAERSTA